jgi:hypothetical protein
MPLNADEWWVFRTAVFPLYSFIAVFSLCVCVCVYIMCYLKGFLKEIMTIHNFGNMTQLQNNCTAVEVQTEYSCIDTTCMKVVCVFALFCMSDNNCEHPPSLPLTGCWVECLVVADISSYCFLTFTYSSLLRTGAAIVRVMLISGYNVCVLPAHPYM